MALVVGRPARRNLGAIVLALSAGALVVFAAACGSSQQQGPAARSTPFGTAPGVFTVYASPDCGCCAIHADYLEDAGFEVELVHVEDVTEIKVSLGIPEEVWSCHTTLVGDYFIEGHVPLEAILMLLDERPDIDGIALPGMPAGSPGMGGAKTEPFIIYAVAEGRVDEYMRI